MGILLPANSPAAGESRYDRPMDGQRVRAAWGLPVVVEESMALRKCSWRLQAAMVCLLCVLHSCKDETVPSRGAKGVCEALQTVGLSTEEIEGADGYACRTVARASTAKGWRDIQVTAYAPATNSDSLEGVVLEGRYARGRSGQEAKQEILAASNVVFSRLNLDVPPGLTLAIQTKSRSEVDAGKLRVNVDHGCDAGAGESCLIRIHIRVSAQFPAARRAGVQG